MANRTSGSARKPSGRSARGVMIVAAAVSCFTLAHAAHADDFVFTPTSGTSGDFADGTQWVDVSGTTTAPAGTTGLIPGPGDRADIAGGNTANFNTTANPDPTATVNTLYLGGESDGGNGNDNFPPGNPNANPVVPPFTANTMGDGTLNMSGGALTVNTWSVVGFGTAGANTGLGTFNLSGGIFHQAGTDNIAIGQGGTGVFNISNGATVQIDSTLNIGRWSGTDKTIADNNAQGRGNGTVTQSDPSTTVTVNGGINVGHGGDGVYTINDGTLNMGGDLIVGGDQSSTGVMNQKGGTVAFTDGAWLRVGNNGGATGTYNMSGGTFTSQSRMMVGVGGTGTFNQTGGTVTAGTGDTTVTDHRDLTIGDNGGNGTYNLSGGVLNANSPNINNQDHGIQVGGWNNSTGALNVSGGTLNASDFAVGRNDPASTTTSNGTVTQTGGTVTVSGSLNLGMDAAGNSNGQTTGTYTLSGGTLTLGTGGLTLGGTGRTGKTGATGIFNLQGTGGGADTGPGGVLDANRSTIQMGVNPGTSSVFTFTGGTLRNAGQILFSLNQAGGTLQAGTPGNPNTTTITGNNPGGDAYTLGSAGTLRVDIANGTNDELLVGSGKVTLAGALQIHETTDAPVGSQYTIIDNTDPIGTGLIVGHFSNDLGSVMADNGQTFSVNYLGGDGNDVVITAKAVPEPATLGLLGGLAGLGLLRRRRRA